MDNLEWYEDRAQYVVITSGDEFGLDTLLYKEGVPHIKDQDLYVHKLFGYVSQLRVKKSVWKNLDSVSQNYIKAFCSGFSIGYDCALIER